MKYNKYCVVTNIALRTALVDALKKSKMRIHMMHVTPDAILDTVEMPAFVTDNGFNSGASFANDSWAQTYFFEKISVEEMFELLLPSNNVHYTDNNVSEPSVTYNKSKDVFSFTQTDFSGEAFKNLIDWAKGFCK